VQHGSLPLPPLRERVDLIEPLVLHGLKSFAARNQVPQMENSAAALHAMRGYRWPGSIRELRNAVERMAALSGGRRIERSTLPEGIQGKCLRTPCQPSQVTPRWRAIRVDAELNAIRSALARNENNRVRTAHDLGISRVTLNKRMHAYGLMS
jgi:two-component system response regulator AtoC